jgi:metal-dependent amidase/aminoacylase/carboxypeptidase family protein
MKDAIFLILYKSLTLRPCVSAVKRFFFCPSPKSAAHAGLEPENGINALVVASHAITKLRLGRIDENTTSNIGVVIGGTAVNIVMPNMSMMYEARSFDGEVLDELLSETKTIFAESGVEFVQM